MTSKSHLMEELTGGCKLNDLKSNYYTKMLSL